MNDRECVALLQWMLPRLGHRWEGYRRVRRQVCRRIAVRLKAIGLADASAYRRRLEADPEEWAALRACLPVTITRFYRDRQVFRNMEAVVLPALAQAVLAAGETTLRVWSAGCANGEEAYSLSLLWTFGLQARFPGIRLAILATDIDAKVLQRAERACYPQSSLKELPADWQQAAFSREDDQYCLNPVYRAPVSFVQQDLLQEMPEGAFHLILCRNLAFTYFDDTRQRRIASDPDCSIGLHPEAVLFWETMSSCRWAWRAFRRFPVHGSVTGRRLLSALCGKWSNAGRECATLIGK